MFPWLCYLSPMHHRPLTPMMETLVLWRRTKEVLAFADQITKDKYFYADFVDS